MRRHSGRMLGPVRASIRPGGQQPLHEDADEDNDNKRQSHRLKQHAPHGGGKHLRNRFDESVDHSGQVIPAATFGKAAVYATGESVSSWVGTRGMLSAAD